MNRRKEGKKGQSERTYPRLAACGSAVQGFMMSSKPFGIFISMLFGASTVQAADNPTGALPPATAAPAAAPAPSLTPAEAYQSFVQQLVTLENLVDLVAQMDTIIDQADNADGSSGLAQNAARADTKSGLHLEFSVIRAPEATMYYAGLSRKNDEMLKYKEATMIFALFCDRIGLTHPIHVTEGEKPVFHAQWLIKPTEWKALRKKILEVRAASRAEKNLFNAMTAAVTQEVNARVAATQSNNRK